MDRQRHHGFDNARCILLFLVVFAHFLEPSGTESRIYKFIYTFHIPALAFLSGLFGSFRPKKLLDLAVIFLLFQILYRAGESILLQERFLLKLYLPYWLLWYLPFLIMCSSLVPLLERFPRFPALAVSLLVSIAAGFIPFIGYGFTASRFFVFLPYYILGRKLRSAPLPRQSRGLLPLLAVTICLTVPFTSESISSRMLYGSFAYFPGYGPLLRCLLYLPGTAWCLTLLLLARRWTVNVPVLSAVGSNTMPLYLFHGFAVKLVSHFTPLPDYPGSLLPALGLTAALLLFFSLPGLLRKPC